MITRQTNKQQQQQQQQPGFHSEDGADPRISPLPKCLEVNINNTLDRVELNFSE